MQVITVETRNPILSAAESDALVTMVGVAPLVGVWLDDAGWHVDGMSPEWSDVIGPGLWRDEAQAGAIRVEITENGVTDPSTFPVVETIVPGMVGHA